MNWNSITELVQLEDIQDNSYKRTIVIFKHSTRCSISSMVLNRLERSAQPSDIDFYLLDLIAHRDISNKIAQTFHVFHESPQILVIKNGECVYDESHNGIRMDEILAL